MNFLKHIIVYLLTTCILVNTWMVTLIHLDFEVRRDYIAKVLCINQDEPITVCGGKCYFNERLKDVADQQEKEAETTNRVLEIAFFKEDLKSIDFSQHKSELKLKITPYESGKVVQFVNGIFRPPRQV